MVCVNSPQLLHRNVQKNKLCTHTHLTHAGPKRRNCATAAGKQIAKAPPPTYRVNLIIVILFTCHLFSAFQEPTILLFLATCPSNRHGVYRRVYVCQRCSRLPVPSERSLGASIENGSSLSSFAARRRTDRHAAFGKHNYLIERTGMGLRVGLEDSTWVPLIATRLKVAAVALHTHKRPASA